MIQIAIKIITISIVVSIITAAIITIIGCWLFRNWVEKEMNRMLDEEGMRTNKFIMEMNAAMMESIRNAYFQK